MSLLDEIVAEERPPNLCRVQEILDRLPPDDAADLASALTGNFRLTTISRVLARRGVKLDPELIGKHRKKACRCRSLTT